MNNKKKVEMLKRLVREIKSKYKNLVINYYYDEEEDFYYVWHNDDRLDFDKEFNKFIDPLIFEFHKKGFKNFVVSYDYDKSTNLKSFSLVYEFGNLSKKYYKQENFIDDSKQIFIAA